MVQRLRSGIKATLVSLYCHGVVGARLTQWLIDALDLREA